MKPNLIIAVTETTRAAVMSSGVCVWRGFRLVLVVLAAVLALGCTSYVVEFAPSGSVAYQHAALCTSSDIAPALRAAAERWHDAAERVNMRVVVVADPEALSEACDVNVFVASMASCEAGEHDDAHCLAFGGQGMIALGPDALEAADLSDILVHELGHNLLGNVYGGADPAHSTDPESVMFWASRPGTQSITSDDVGRLP